MANVVVVCDGCTMETPGLDSLADAIMCLTIRTGAFMYVQGGEYDVANPNPCGPKLVLPSLLLNDVCLLCMHALGSSDFLFSSPLASECS